MKFFTGIFNLSDAHKVENAFISVNRLRPRRSAFKVGEWIMDSGSFTTIVAHGGYPEPPEAYADEISRWADNGGLLAAVSQDFMCEPQMVERTGLSVAEHQRLTIDRFDAIRTRGTAGVYLMPVLQGYDPSDYVRHLGEYGHRIEHGGWIGVGSVCKRNGSPEAIATILRAIKDERPDVRLHGFGVKTTSLARGAVYDSLYTADSMAWSYHARKNGLKSNDINEALRFGRRIATMPVQSEFYF